MANIAGVAGYVQPGVFTRVRTIRRSVSIPGGLRILAMIGEGRSEETIVLSAEGDGADGVNPDYSASTSPDGRHFELSKTNLVAARTTLYKNDIPLTGLEETIDTDPFDSDYDYRLETSTGRIELQRAHLVSQGGSYAPANANNTGTGTVSFIELIDANAPAETWTLRATSIIRDSYGDPIPESASFTLTGSESGQVNDAYGAPIYFISDGTIRDNGVLRLSITEGTVAFDRHDRFTIKIDSGVLSAGDTLEARYVADEDLNDPELFVDANKLYQKHGFPSTDNTLSLGASMAFENGAYGILAVQAKPPMPRRTTETLIARDDPLTTGTEGFPNIGPSVTVNEVDSFKYTINDTPDSDTAVNLFVIDRSDGTETQIFPTKVSFYNSSITDDPYNNFIDNANYSYSYTVILDGEVEDEGDDGEVAYGGTTFTADSASFSAYNVDVGENDTAKQIRILTRDKYGDDASDVAGSYDILSVGDGTGDDTVVTLDTTGFNATASDLMWQLVDPADTSAKVLITKDLYTGGTIRNRDGLSCSYITIDDSDYFDTNWATALESLEPQECQMIVPLPTSTISNIQQATVSHCELMSSTSNKKERVALIGAQQGVTSAALTGLELIAVEDIGIIEGIQGDDAAEILADNIEDLQNFDCSSNWGTTFRAIYFWPDQIVRSINGTNTYIDGFYMAAAAGGLLAATANVAIPLTRKVLTGFTILRDKVRKPYTLNALGNKGVTVVQPVTGGGRILHCKTTTSSGAVTEEEPSVIFIRDRTAQVLRSVLDGFIGKPEDPTLVASITKNVQSAMQALQSQGLIQNFRNLSVARDEVDARQFNVAIEVQPTLPICWISVDVSVGIF